MTSFELTFEPVAELQVLLWTFLGLDHRQRSRLRVAWPRHSPAIHNETPKFFLPGQNFHLTGAVVEDLYMDFLRRARERHRAFRDDARLARPPVNDRGRPVFVAWDRDTGLPRRLPFEDSPAALGGRAWVSSDRAVPLLTAYADPRYWRGDSPASWGGRFDYSQVWPPASVPRVIPGDTFVGHWPSRLPDPQAVDGTWTFGRLPDIISLGHRGGPLRDMPPDPRQ